MFQSLRTRILLLLIIIMLFASSIPIFFAQREIYNAMIETEKANARNTLYLITLHLEEANKTLTFQTNKEYEMRLQVLKDMTDIVINRIEGFQRYVEQGRLTTGEAKRLVAEEIRSFRYGKNDYVVIVDEDYNGISHPDSQYMGKKLYNLQDSFGTYFIRSMVNNTVKNGEASTEYWIPRLNTATDLQKLSYSVYYPQWKWIIYTGFYTDDIDQSNQKALSVVIEGLKGTFDKITIGETGYLFLMNEEKRMMIHPNISMDDDFGIMKNPHTGNYLADELVKAAFTPYNSLVYLWNHPEDENNYSYWKETYMAYYRPLGWFVGYSVYLDELEAPARNMGKKLIILFLIYLLLALIISIFFSNTMIDPIKKLIFSMRTIKEKGFVEIALPHSGLREINEMGEIFSQMVESVKNAHERLEMANEKILDSINYAHLIQNSILPDLSTIQAFLPNSFIVWLPRDIVSGDFYQFYPVPGGYYLIVGDCTGHGVPGGFMTMLVASVLRRIIFAEQVYDPGLILTRLNIIIKNSLNQSVPDSSSNDGLDGAICYVKPLENVIEFAGARSSLYMSHKDTGIMEIQGNRKSVGYADTKTDYIFTTHTIKVQQGTRFFMSTDGLIDQLGEEVKLPFGKKRLFKFMEENKGVSFNLQKEKLITFLNHFQGEQERLDDITVIGFRL